MSSSGLVNPVGPWFASENGASRKLHESDPREKVLPVVTAWWVLCVALVFMVSPQVRSLLVPLLQIGPIAVLLACMFVREENE